MHDQGAAADAGRLRLDQSQHHLRRDGRVDRTAARIQHLQCCACCQRVGSHRSLLRRHCGNRVVGLRRLKRWPVGRLKRTATQQQERDAKGRQASLANGPFNDDGEIPEHAHSFDLPGFGMAQTPTGQLYTRRPAVSRQRISTLGDQESGANPGAEPVVISTAQPWITHTLPTRNTDKNKYKQLSL